MRLRLKLGLLAVGLVAILLAVAAIAVGSFAMSSFLQHQRERADRASGEGMKRLVHSGP